MKFQELSIGLLLFVGLVSWTACQSTRTSNTDGYNTTLTFGPGEEDKINEALLTLKDSTLIELKEGKYQFDNLSLAQLNHIRIHGQGPEHTILDFSNQSSGGEGIRVTNLRGFEIEGLKLQNAKGDLIKVTKSRDIVFRNVYAVWDKSDSSSGGYALYPVMCKNILIENCYVQGSSDAGIYVGQSDSAIVRNSKAFKNVAGCEIENTTHAEVYGNEFWGNCAGFLIFDLPTLSKRGGFVKAHDNNIHDNNERNFAKAGSFGTTWGVGNAAPGSGIIILAASHIELYLNQILNNNSGAIALASGLAVDDSALSKISDNYFPISKDISIHDNTMQMGNAFPAPALAHHMGKLLVGIEEGLVAKDPSRKGKRIPYILYDGVSTNLLTHGSAANPDSLCIHQSGDNIFVNADLVHIQDPKQWHPSLDITPFVCK